MGNWLTEHWFDLAQTTGIVIGFVFTARALHRDETARRIANMIAIADRHTRIWQEFFQRPELSRVLDKNADTSQAPVTATEKLFVKILMLHLDTVRRAIKSGLFIKIEGLKDDIRSFISLPIPKAVWEMIKPFQDKEFVKLVESALE